MKQRGCLLVFNPRWISGTGRMPGKMPHVECLIVDSANPVSAQSHQEQLANQESLGFAFSRGKAQHLRSLLVYPGFYGLSDLLTSIRVGRRLGRYTAFSSVTNFVQTVAILAAIESGHTLANPPDTSSCSNPPSAGEHFFSAGPVQTIGADTNLALTTSTLGDSEDFPVISIQPVSNTGNWASDAVCADFNGDGAPDLAIVYAYDALVRVYAGGKQNAFNEAREYSVAAQNQIGNANRHILPRRLLAQDLNRDGKLDLAILCSGWYHPALPVAATDATLRILYSNQKGGFGRLEVLRLARDNNLATKCVALAGGALDREGTFYLVTGHSFYPATQITVVRGSVRDKWEVVAVYDVAKNSAGFAGLEMADLDGDGFGDLIIASKEDIRIWFGAGAGRFDRADPVYVGGGLVGIALGRLNRDTRHDLVSVDSQTKELLVFLGRETNGGADKSSGRSFSFDEPRKHRLFSTPTGFAVLDADLDGFSDVAVIYRDSEIGNLFFGPVFGALGSANLFKEKPFGFRTPERASFIVSGDLGLDDTQDLVLLSLEEGYDLDIPVDPSKDARTHDFTVLLNTLTLKTSLGLEWADYR